MVFVGLYTADRRVTKITIQTRSLHIVQKILFMVCERS